MFIFLAVKNCQQATFKLKKHSKKTAKKIAVFLFTYQSSGSLRLYSNINVKFVEPVDLAVKGPPSFKK